MIITAKFSSRCPTCSTLIPVGAQVQWAKGGKARHVTCPSVTDNAQRARKVYEEVYAELAGGIAQVCTVRDHEVWVRRANQSPVRFARTAEYDIQLAPYYPVEA